MTRLCFAGVTIILLGATFAWSDDLTTITGKGNLNGSLEKITDADIVIKAGDKEVPTPLAQVLDLKLRDIRKTPEAEKYLEVNLADESVLRCTKVTLGNKEALLVLTTGVTVKAPMPAVLTVLRGAQDGAIKSQFDKLKRDKKRSDRIYVSGAGGLNPIAGALGSVDEAKQTIKFRPEGKDEVELSLEKLQAVQFAAVEVPAAAALCKVIDLDGNVLVASKLSYDSGQATLTTPYGQKIALENKLLAKLDFNFGRLTFLSDLDAKIADSVLLGGFSPVRKDANLDGNPIMMQDKKYDKGLSMYAGAQIEYALSGKYKKLSGILGVDSRIAEEGQGKVTLKIFCDNEEKFSKEVSTTTPTPISLNIQDVFLLRIVVVGSNFTNYSGHATLANAQVSQ
jgi:NPCBM/NEW2 domain-containing protein